MLVSDKYEFIVAMPTKTGTNSLRGLVEKWKRSGGDLRVLNLLSGEAQTRHRIAPPSGRENYTRFMLVRDPFARMVSMYEYLRRKEWEWQAKVILDMEARSGREAAWLHMLDLIEITRAAPGYGSDAARKAHGIRPFMWTDMLTEMRTFMGQGLAGGKHHVGVLKLEDLEDDWHELLDAVDADEEELWDISMPHRNATPGEGKLFESGEEYWGLVAADNNHMDGVLIGDLITDAAALGYNEPIVLR